MRKMNFTVQYREGTGKGFNRKLRQQGLTPGIIYGMGDPAPVSMNTDTTLRYIKSMKGSTKAFQMEMKSDDETKSKQVIIQDYQMSNYGDKLLHVDFLEITDETQLTIEVPIVVKNAEICPAVKTGGVLQIIRRSIPVQCTAKYIPELIEIGVEALEFGESVHVLDIEYPEGVKPIVYGRNFTVVTVVGRAPEEAEAEEIEGLEEGAEGAEGEVAAESTEGEKASE